jgi:serine/threonine protein kinase
LCQDAAEATVVPELGTVLGGKYRILRILGEGGMGVVFEAENVLTLKRSAIKWLHPQLVAHEEAYSRVLHEARASARIRHHNVVDVYDVVSDGDSIFLVMELLIGEPLSALIARGGLVMDRFIALLLPAMRAVAAAHAVGVIHRDIKPENIFLVSEAGQPAAVPKVIDFGISKVIDPALGAHLTRSGVTMGTPKYVSYEQLAGARDVDVRADVYAMGVILYEALVGRPPYEAQSFGQQAIRFATTVPTHVGERRPDAPLVLAEIVMCAIARERERRFPSMNALIEVLEPFASPDAYAEPLEAFPYVAAPELIDGVDPALTTTPAVTTPPPGPAPSGRGPRPSPPPEITRREQVGAFTRGALTVLPLVVLGVVVLWWQRTEPREPSASPAPAATNVAPAQVSAPLLAPTAQPPAADRVAVPEGGATEPPLASPPELAEPKHGRHRDGTSPAKSDGAARHPMEAAEGEPDGGVSNPHPGGARKTIDADDDGMHRAGRVTRDQF